MVRAFSGVMLNDTQRSWWISKDCKTDERCIYCFEAILHVYKLTKHMKRLARSLQQLRNLVQQLAQYNNQSPRPWV